MSPGTVRLGCCLPGHSLAVQNDGHLLCGSALTHEFQFVGRQGELHCLGLAGLLRHGYLLRLDLRRNGLDGYLAHTLLGAVVRHGDGDAVARIRLHGHKPCRRRFRHGTFPLDIGGHPNVLCGTADRFERQGCRTDRQCWFALCRFVARHERQCARCGNQ